MNTATPIAMLAPCLHELVRNKSFIIHVKVYIFCNCHYPWQEKDRRWKARSKHVGYDQKSLINCQSASKQCLLTGNLLHKALVQVRSVIGDVADTKSAQENVRWRRRKRMLVGALITHALSIWLVDMETFSGVAWRFAFVFLGMITVSLRFEERVQESSA